MNPLWTGRALAEATGGRFTGAPPDAISGLSIDTRTLQPGDLFVALVGGNGDGHAHVARALENGAAAALVHSEALLPAALRGDTRLLHVADTFAALHALGRAGRARFGGRMLAVTGSVGKTTTKEMLRTALGALGSTHAAQSSFNNHWGVPLTLGRLPADAAFCVCEIGMNHPGEIAPLAALVRPEVAIVTTVAATHIGNMGSLEAIAREKSALFGALPAGGTALFPVDAPHAGILDAAARRASARIVRVGSDARLSDLSLDAAGSQAVAVLPGGTVRLALSVPGAHMAANALCCLAAIEALGLDPVPAAVALAGFAAGDGRGALRPILGGAASLLDESYNASGASIRASLSVLALLPARRRIAVLGDMLELGAFARPEHQSLEPAVRSAADLVFCSGEMMKHLFDTLPPALRGGHAADARTLAPLVTAVLRPGDVVLVKGSFGSRMRDVVAALAATQPAAAVAG